ncbi:flagellar basal body-associated protein FliL [Alkalicoccus chagannorensis]|uniref:flagellar basal body-associated protein FliL n=1 Tax=Alkalicoccus chagannorensis TaxID=427072 RepID=UPI0004246FDF|nr:flagellar basal body-associated protein FliL [Alkalicoccus chagannorensis]
MFQNRLVNIMLIILAALTLIGVLTFVLFTQFFQTEGENEEPSIEEVIARSVETEEITTNLRSNQVIRASFVIEADSTEAADELEQRNFQVENIIIRQLADMSVNDFQGSEGIQTLENSIGSELNNLMQEGSVSQVYMREKVVQ